MRTPRALIGMTLAAALALSACGGGDDGRPTSSDHTTASATTTESTPTPSPTLTADDDRPLTGTTLKKASDAALKATDGGKITETSGSDDADHVYEVDVLLPSGEDVTVELDQSFKVTKLDR
jgi:ABC-type glycerol-3-phosphate transport system substrate-binding protein